MNEAQFGFTPDAKNDRIFYSLKGINGIGDEVAYLIINNRPYKSFEDFCTRMIETKLIKTSQMVQLIKAGCFTEFEPDIFATMKQFITKYILSPCTSLGLQQFNQMVKLNVIPEKLQESVSIKNFKEYVLHKDGLFKSYVDPNSERALPKCGYNDRFFKLDGNSQPFFESNFSEDSVADISGEYYVISEKKFSKEVNAKIQPLKDWFTKEETIKEYNEALFSDLWDKHASGTRPQWEMDSLSFYYTEHELANLNEQKYMIKNYFDMPEEPEIYDYYTRTIKGEKKQFPKNTIHRIAGTVLDKNKDKHTITLLTKYGVVNCKFNKGQFIYYNKSLSVVNNSGKKTVVEKPWLSRGNKVFVCGYRQGDQFRVYNYSDTIFNHVVSKIEEIYEDGTVDLLTERAQIGEA